ncbi:MAG: HAMP domain-containing protein [Deltaproteobacteria bacterium]|nr:HAMP domain-containing protein [Deltaproteobacteria bacterium]MBW1951622.1 HAMP domain-containing protein [Deltaproteobacteria bacterium]MBW1986639.1 HAMP domain-containing protein [Deltaproteobacteria bacterium]MBW2134760.1 HAMP domain-containing protein [Deltaproteobacteria bacterium]
MPSPARATAFSPSQAKEYQRRRRERIIIFIIFLLIVTITYLEVRLVSRGGEPVTGSMLAFGLVNLNTILLLVLIFLIFRNLSKLFLERRQKIFGSRLRVRLVLTFVTLSLLPTLLMSFVAFQFISNRVEYQLDTRVEQSLKNALALSQEYYQGMEHKVHACSRVLAREINDQGLLAPEKVAALAAFLDQTQQEYHLTGIEIFDQQGNKLSQSQLPQNVGLPDTEANLLQSAQVREAGRVYRQVTDQGELLQGLTPLGFIPGTEIPEAYLVVSQLIPRPISTQIAGIARGVSDLRDLQLLLRPVRVGHYIALLIVTLLVIMSAIWLAFYMAKEITTPIQQLAEGTLKVADGDYNIHIDLEGRDEIGFLVQSFNKMTQDLQHSRAQLAAANQQLSRSNEELETRRRYMEVVLQNVAAGVISLDADSRITTINDSAQVMLGLRAEEILGQDARQLLPADQFDKVAEVIAEAQYSGRSSMEKPLQINLPDHTLSLLIKPTVLKDEQGRYLGVVVVFEDLTELERAQRLAAWREVARRIAHEVKNPLTPIQLSAQRLWRRYADQFGDDGQVFRECTQMIIKQVEELKNLVNEFYQFARFPQLSLAPCDINALINETLILYQEIQPQVTLEFHPDNSLGAIPLDREQIKRVLFNLLDNAIASRPETVAINISSRLDQHLNRAELVIADNGAGIPDRDKPRVFEPYFSTKRSGTGLGLAIVQSIITEHQGSIRVEDNYPQGSRFVIELPLSR